MSKTTKKIMILSATDKRFAPQDKIDLFMEPVAESMATPKDKSQKTRAAAKLTNGPIKLVRGVPGRVRERTRHALLIEEGPLPFATSPLGVRLLTDSS